MPTRDEYVDSIKTAFKNLGTRIIMQYLQAQVPIFKITFLRRIAEFFVEHLIVKLVDNTEMAVFFVYTDVRVNAQGNAFIKAALEYRSVQLSKDKERLKDAEKALLESFYKFASLTK